MVYKETGPNLHAQASEDGAAAAGAEAEAEDGVARASVSKSSDAWFMK